jgi:hypothetical protein
MKINLSFKKFLGYVPLLLLFIIPVVLYGPVILMYIQYMLNDRESILYDKIELYVEENCKDKDTCYLSLKYIIDFEWDKFHFIYASKNPSEVLGFEYPFNADISNVIIFLKDGKIVHHEEHIDDPEKDSKLSFCKAKDNCSYFAGKDYLTFVPENANFYAERWWSKKTKKYCYHFYLIASALYNPSSGETYYNYDGNGDKKRTTKE